AKVGGLADMVGGLTQDLLAKGHTVEVYLPMYHSMRYDLIAGLEKVYDELWVPHFGQWVSEEVYAGKIGKVPCYFFPCGDRFHRDSIYGYDDDLYRFVHFNRAVLEFMTRKEIRPDIIHCHDWQMGLLPVLLFEHFIQWGFDRSRVVFTIHNIEQQGACWYGSELLGSVGLDCRNYFSFERLRDERQPNMINLMKAGIVFSNFVTTVSPTYCRDICTPEGGHGLDHILNHHHAKLGGVLNGLDYDYWNPETDSHLALNYSADTFKQKYANKNALRARTSLPDEYRPIISCVTRLVPQKGLDLIRHAVFAVLEAGGQFVLLGESPDEKVNNDFRALGAKLIDNPNVYIEIGYNEEFSRQIYAGADMFFMPSLFEPCGLSQLIALRYGAVPLVRKTGGLADTIFDAEYSDRGFPNANGFLFNDPDPSGVDSVIKRAFKCWFFQGEAFRELAYHGMLCDYSWRRSGKDYENIYNHVKVK
ncbi:MAG: glycogen synthase, partial [Planctomycetes bacterium]|nr:glycogen synthase [Planctomycetota bacterium]